MTRAKGGFKTRHTHKKVLKLAKGYRGTRNRLFKRANEAVLRAGEHAFEGRKQRKRDMRRLWIARISAALMNHDIMYSRFMNGVLKSKIGLNRKALSELAVLDPKAFTSVVETAKKHLA